MSSTTSTRRTGASTLPMTGIDKLMVVSFAIFFVIGCVVDYINAISPADGGVTRETAKLWSWPPPPVFDAYFWWCDICDPILQINPLWIKYLSMLSPFVFCPFYLVAIYAIIKRREWIRIPIIIYSAILFIDLSAFFVEAIWGKLPSPNMWIFTAGYGYYQLFPVIAIARMWHDHPFTKNPPCQAQVVAALKTE